MNRDENRLMFPKFAEAMGALRALYPNAKVRYVEEDGRSVGRVPPPDECEIDGDSVSAYLALQKAARARDDKAVRR